MNLQEACIVVSMRSLQPKSQVQNTTKSIMIHVGTLLHSITCSFWNLLPVNTNEKPMKERRRIPGFRVEFFHG